MKKVGLLFLLCLAFPLVSADKRACLGDLSRHSCQAKTEAICKRRPVDEFLYPLMQKKTSRLCQQVFGIKGLSQQIGSYLNPQDIKDGMKQALGGDNYGDSRCDYAKMKQLLSLGFLYQQLNEYKQNLMTDLSREHSENCIWFDISLKNKDTKTVTFFVRHGADVNACNWYGHTILIEACLCGHEDIGAFLIKFGIDVNKRDCYTCFLSHIKKNDGLTPLYAAVDKGKSFYLAQLLIERGADIYAKYYGTTAMHAIIRRDCINVDKKMCQLFFDKHFDMTTQNHRGETLLYSIAGHSTSDHISYLLEHGAQSCLAIGDREGMTPLHIAAVSWKIENAKLLLQSGADYRLKNKEGKTPLQVAAERPDYHCAKNEKEAFVKFLTDYEQSQSQR